MRKSITGYVRISCNLKYGMTNVVLRVYDGAAVERTDNKKHGWHQSPRHPKIANTVAILHCILSSTSE